jgi:hypothetical protein
MGEKELLGDDNLGFWRGGEILSLGVNALDPGGSGFRKASLLDEHFCLNRYRLFFVRSTALKNRAEMPS